MSKINEKKKYILYAQEVSEEVYLAYHRVNNRERALRRKDQKHGVVFYSNMDTEETLGEEMIPDLQSPSVEDYVLEKIKKEQLYFCLSLLTNAERDLIYALYFENLTEREYAARIGVSQTSVNRRKHKIEEKLQKMMQTMFSSSV